MEEEITHLFHRRPRRQLVFPFLELDNQMENDIVELWREGRTMVEVVEISEDGRLLSIKEDPEL